MGENVAEQELFKTVAAAVGILATIGTIIQLITKGVEYLLLLPRRYRRWQRKSDYIILPTLQEVAIYGVKAPQAHTTLKNFAAEWLEDKFRKVVLLARARMIALMVMFGIAFLLCAIRLTYLASLHQ